MLSVSMPYHTIGILKIAKSVSMLNDMLYLVTVQILKIESVNQGIKFWVWWVNNPELWPPLTLLPSIPWIVHWYLCFVYPCQGPPRPTSAGLTCAQTFRCVRRSTTRSIPVAVLQSAGVSTATLSFVKIMTVRMVEGLSFNVIVALFCHGIMCIYCLYITVVMLLIHQSTDVREHQKLHLGCSDSWTSLLISKQV